MAVAPSETGDDARAQRLVLAGTTEACRLGAQEESVVLGPQASRFACKLDSQRPAWRHWKEVVRQKHQAYSTEKA